MNSTSIYIILGVSILAFVFIAIKKGDIISPDIIYKNGIVGDAIVTGRKSKYRQPQKRTMKKYYLVVEIIDVKRNVELEVSLEDYNRINNGKRIEVKYLEDRPEYAILNH